MGLTGQLIREAQILVRRHQCKMDSPGRPNPLSPAGPVWKAQLQDPAVSLSSGLHTFRSCKRKRTLRFFYSQDLGLFSKVLILKTKQNKTKKLSFQSSPSLPFLPAACSPAFIAESKSVRCKGLPHSKGLRCKEPGSWICLAHFLATRATMFTPH